MTHRPSPTPSTVRRRRGLARRVKRGIVAGYIHEISQRHAAPALAPVTTPAPAPAPAAGGCPAAA